MPSGRNFTIQSGGIVFQLDFTSIKWRLRDLCQLKKSSALAQELVEAAGRLASCIERMGLKPLMADRSTFMLNQISDASSIPKPVLPGLVRSKRPALPDAHLVRQIIAQRRLRDRYFGGSLFADPAWDIMLDLTAARVEHVRVSISSLCIAAAVPPTTALRWIGNLVERGLLVRTEDEMDKRRVFVDLSDQAASSIAYCFSHIENARGASLRAVS